MSRPPVEVNDPRAISRSRRGIRFHLALAALFLVVVAAGIGLYSARTAEDAQRRGTDQQRGVETAVRAARLAFETATGLAGGIDALAHGGPADLRSGIGERLRVEIGAIRSRLTELSGAIGRLDPAPANKAAPRAGQLPVQPHQRITQAIETTEDLERAVATLVTDAAALYAADQTMVQRIARLEQAHAHHVEAVGEAEVTMRALVSRALAVDLVIASRKGWLQQRIDEVLEREFSWVATVQDLMVDSRELIGRARDLADAQDVDAIPTLQGEMAGYATRLQLHQRLPVTPVSATLEAATEAYVGEADAAPTLGELRRRTLEAKVARDQSLARAAAQRDRLSTTLYDLSQELAEYGRTLLEARQRSQARQERAAQISTIAAGFFALALIAYYLATRVIRPLERLTDAMHTSSRGLVPNPGQDIAPLQLPDTPMRDDEVGVMTQALRVLHKAISERDRALLDHQDRLHHLAHHDALTGLPNRTLLSDRIEREMAAVQRSGRLLAVALLDLDGFKQVNDRLGHAGGDKLLIAVAGRIHHAIRDQDTLARLGGDELALLLPDLSDNADAETVLQRVLGCFDAPFEPTDNHPITVSASIGYTLFPVDNAPGDVLMRHADQAMYAAKRTGKARLLAYDAERDREEGLLHSDLAAIERALHEGQLELHYQPMIDLCSAEVIGAEALLRWRHPERGLIGPADLLRCVTGTELAVRIGSWVLETAVRETQTWRCHGGPFIVSVNVSAEQLHSDQFIETVRHLVLDLPGDSGDRPQRVLQLEVVETVALEDMERVAGVLNTCRRLGARVALDDFGTGYSSLTYVRRLPVDTLKIDRSFVLGMLDNAEDRYIVESIVALARALGRGVLAEGVERPEQGQALVTLGCHLAQGFGIAKPMPAADLPTWLEKWPRSSRALSLAD